MVNVCRSTIARLGQQIESLEGSNTMTRDEILLVHDSLSEMRRENTLLRCENSALHEGHQRQLQVSSVDLLMYSSTENSCQLNF